MEIKLYARSPNQEFSADTGQPGEYLYKWPSRHQSPLDARQRNDSEPLAALVCLRRENRGHGFVHNLKNNLVFYADAEACEVIDANLREPLSRIATTCPWLLDALCVTP